MTISKKIAGLMAVVAIALTATAGNALAFTSGAFEQTDFDPINTAITSGVSIGMTTGMKVFAILIAFTVILYFLHRLGLGSIGRKKV